MLETEDFDCIQLEFSFMGHYQLDSKVFSCLDEHNVEFNIHYRFYQQEKNPARKLYRYLEYQKVRAEEIRLAKTFDHVFYPSKIDAQTMRQYLSRDVSVVPNGVDIEYFQPCVNVQDGPFLYFGAMNYAPMLMESSISPRRYGRWLEINVRQPNSRLSGGTPGSGQTIGRQERNKGDRRSCGY